jgi:superfamily II DNA/RNA helicase
VLQAEKELFASHSGVAGINFSQYDAIPVECKGPGSAGVAPLESFGALQGQLPAFVFHNLQMMRYASPTPIQRYSIPCALGLGLAAPADVMACAQTGSGKTCSFLLPVVAALGASSCAECGQAATGRVDSADGQFYCDGCWDALVGADAGPAAAYAVVMAPTRELAIQAPPRRVLPGRGFSRGFSLA